MSTNWNQFRAVCENARTKRTVEATLPLLGWYADTKCATYPADSQLFRELWPNEKPPGFVLTPYAHMNTHTVRMMTEEERAAQAAPTRSPAVHAYDDATWDWFENCAGPNERWPGRRAYCWGSVEHLPTETVRAFEGRSWLEQLKVEAPCHGATVEVARDVHGSNVYLVFGTASEEERHAAAVEAGRKMMQDQWDAMSDEEARDTWATWCS